MWIRGSSFREILRVRNWNARNEEFILGGGVLLRFLEVSEINPKTVFKSFVCTFLEQSFRVSGNFRGSMSQSY